MAASQNPIQGSLFGETKLGKLNEPKQIKNSEISNKNLSNQELKNDAFLRPRKKKTPTNPNQIFDCDDFSNAENSLA